MNLPLRTLLIVDDSTEDREAVKRLLLQDTDHSYHFFEAENGRDGLALCREKLPDCILLDYKMPEADGAEILQQLITEHGANNIPVVMLSGSSEINVAVNALKFGAHDFLIKDAFNLEDLLNTVDNAIEIVSRERQYRIISQQLRQSKEHLSALINHSIGGIAEADISGCFTLVNDRFCEITGYTREELVGKLRMQDITHPEDLPHNLELLRELIENCVPFNLEKRYLCKNGSWVWVSNSVSAIADADGKLQLIVAVVIDITARKCAEEISRQTEARFSTLFNSIDEGVCTVKVLYDEFGHVVDLQLLEANPAFKKHTGITDPVGKRASELVPGMEQEWNELYEHVATTGEAVHQENYSETLNRWFDIRLSRIGDKGSDKVAVVFTDISERKRHELNLAFLGVLQQVFDSVSTPENIKRKSGALIADYLRLSHCLLTEVNVRAGKARVLFDECQPELNNLTGTNYRLADLYTEAELHHLAAGNPLVINDVGQQQRPTPALSKILGSQAFIIVPYISRGQWKFSICAHHSRPYQWHTSEVELLSELARRIYLRLERARAERDLQESEARFRTLFNSIDEGFVTIELMFDANKKPVDYRFIQANPAFERLTGLENPIGKTARELVPDLEEFWFETYGKVALTGDPVRFENKSEALNRWFDVYALRVGDSMSRVALIFNNITERKLSEQALRETAEFNRTVLESSQDCVKVLDTQGRLQYMNANGLALMEVTDFERLKNQVWWDIWPTNCEQSIRRSMENALRGDVGRFQEFCPTLNGTPKWWDILVSPVRGEAGQIISLLAVARDITAQKHAEQERETLLEREQMLRQQAEESNRSKDEFLALLSHELRTPLTSIMGWATMLKNKTLSAEKSTLAIDIINDNARQQNALIEDLLDVSRIISGKMKLEPGVVDLKEIVAATVETVRPAAELKHIPIEMKSGLLSAKIKGDEHRLKQIAGNLLTNAIKFTPEGGRITVELIPSREQTIQLIISDTGCGMKADLVPHIFERFKQADSSMRRSYGGLGLGLAIVRSLVELHGGRVWAMSNGENQGSTFTVELPLIEPVEMVNPHPSTNMGNKQEKSNAIPLLLAGINVMVVEDYEAIRDMVEFLLTHHGAYVVSASTVQDALQKITESPPDIIISDIGMAGMNGLDLIKHVRSLSLNGNRFIPAIAMTGYADIEDRDRVLAAGYQIHAVKPFDVNELPFMVAKLFNEYNTLIDHQKASQ
ncbi:MAG: PAS domain S-box protein [Methylobacter sp.]|nr:PAS domain S-box protein [Methylobacter sp.]